MLKIIKTKLEIFVNNWQKKILNFSIETSS